jgi:N4-gp56 family major capsid protein
MAVSSTSTNSANLHLYYVKKALSVLQPRLALYNLGKKTALPFGNGKQVKWLQYTKISSSSSSLTEGTAPSEGSFTTANVTATIAQYGQFVKVSDLLEMTAIDPVIESLSELFGRAAAESVEDLIAAQLDSTLTTMRVNGRADNDAIVAGDVVTAREFLRAMINLKGAYVGPHEMGKYIAVLHPSCEYDIMSETNVGGWLDVNSYVGLEKENILRGEIGQLYGIRFMTSDKMTAADNASTISVKNNYVLGEECFGVVDLGGAKGSKNFEIVIKDADSGGVANPLNQYSTVGYKIKGFAAKNFAAGRGRILKGTTALSAA